MKKIIAICASPRKKNTYYMLKTILDSSKKEYEIVFLKNLKINPCSACENCHKKPYKCSTKDRMPELCDKLEKADIVILGSPTYFDNVSGMMKNFIDRCLPFYFSRKLEGKKTVVASVGSEDAESISQCVNAMQRFCKHMGLDVVSSVYATKSNPKSKEKELLKIGKFISSL